MGRRERHHWRRLARVAAAAEANAQQDWTTHAKPAAETLDRRIVRAEHRVADLESQAPFRHRWLAEHPELARRVEYVPRVLDRLAGINRGDPPVATKALEHDDIAKVLERLDRLERPRTIEPPGLSL
jgi:hypothetical protein